MKREVLFPFFFFIDASSVNAIIEIRVWLLGKVEVSSQMKRSSQSSSNITYANDIGLFKNLK